MPHGRKKVGRFNWPSERFRDIKKKRRTKRTKVHRLLKDDTFDPLIYLRQRRNGIPCRKYHYQINSFCYYDATFYMSPDGKSFVISHRHEEGEDAHADHAHGHQSAGADVMGELRDCTKEFRIEDVQGFVFGGFASRFWVQRRGINEIIAHEKAAGHGKALDHILPYYAWECITIQLPDRNIDLVVREEIHMQLLLKVLILALDSFDSHAGSIRSLREIKVIRRATSCAAMMHSIYKGYLIMRVRMKLSYEAAIQRKTLQELFLHAILKSYMERDQAKLVPNPWPKLRFSLADLTTSLNLVELYDVQRRCAHGACNQQNILRAVKSKKYIGTCRGGASKDTYVQKLISQSIMKVGKVDDIFRNVIYEIPDAADDDDLNEIIYRNQVKKYKMGRAITTSSAQADRMCLSKLDLMKTLRIVQGPVYIVAMLESIRLTRQIFMKDL